MLKSSRSKKANIRTTLKGRPDEVVAIFHAWSRDLATGQAHWLWAEVFQFPCFAEMERPSTMDLHYQQMFVGSPAARRSGLFLRRTSRKVLKQDWKFQVAELDDEWWVNQVGTYCTGERLGLTLHHSSQSPRFGARTIPRAGAGLQKAITSTSRPNHSIIDTRTWRAPHWSESPVGQIMRLSRTDGRGPCDGAVRAQIRAPRNRAS